MVSKLFEGVPYPGTITRYLPPGSSPPPGLALRCRADGSGAAGPEAEDFALWHMEYSDDEEDLEVPLAPGGKQNKTIEKSVEWRGPSPPAGGEL